ncbi:hypothetical protein FB451DRAFT_1472629 [Mycena latifolia]|nr:hypothetical protein FB451DRAFT_1472629 [Mycena latifolia]
MFAILSSSSSAVYALPPLQTIRWVSFHLVLRPAEQARPCRQLQALRSFRIHGRAPVASPRNELVRPAAPSAAISVAGMLTCIMMLMPAVHPFYWPSAEMGHSPLIVTRAGWISIAIMPLMINTSYEKLQVFHRWSSVLMWIMSLVHTFPFIINRVGNVISWYTTSPRYWTGITALLQGTFRNPCYDIFKKLHFIVSGVFMTAVSSTSTSGSLHGAFLLTPILMPLADIAQGLLMGNRRHLQLCLAVARCVRTLYMTGFGVPTTIESAGPGLIKLTIRIPVRFKWASGQHAFAPILGLGSLPVSGAAELLLARQVRTDSMVGHVPFATHQRLYLLASGTGGTIIANALNLPLSITSPVSAALKQISPDAVGEYGHFRGSEAENGSDSSVNVVRWQLTRLN